jgi:hypothetical protein
MSRSNAEDSNQIPGALGVKHPGYISDFYGSGFDKSGSESSSDSSSSGSASPLSPEKSAPVKKVSSTGIGASSDSRDVLNPTLVESAIASAIDSVKSAIVQNKKAGESIDALTVLNDKRGREIANLQAISKQTDKKLSQRKAVSKPRKRVAKSRDQPSTKPTRKGKKTKAPKVRELPSSPRKGKKTKAPKTRESLKSPRKSSKGSNSGDKKAKAKPAARLTTETNRELVKLESDVKNAQDSYDEVNSNVSKLNIVINRYENLKAFLEKGKEKAAKDLEDFNNIKDSEIQNFELLASQATLGINRQKTENARKEETREHNLKKVRRDIVKGENVLWGFSDNDNNNTGVNAFGDEYEDDNVDNNDEIVKLKKEQSEARQAEEENITALEKNRQLNLSNFTALRQTRNDLEKEVRSAEKKIKTAAKNNNSNLKDLKRLQKDLLNASQNVREASEKVRAENAAIEHRLQKAIEARLEAKLLRNQQNEHALQNYVCNEALPSDMKNSCVVVFLMCLIGGNLSRYEELVLDMNVPFKKGFREVQRAILTVDDTKKKQQRRRAVRGGSNDSEFEDEVVDEGSVNIDEDEGRKNEEVKNLGVKRYDGKRIKPESLRNLESMFFQKKDSTVVASSELVDTLPKFVGELNGLALKSEQFSVGDANEFDGESGLKTEMINITIESDENDTHTIQRIMALNAKLTTNRVYGIVFERRIFFQGTASASSTYGCYFLCQNDDKDDESVNGWRFYGNDEKSNKAELINLKGHDLLRHYEGEQQKVKKFNNRQLRIKHIFVELTREETRDKRKQTTEKQGKSKKMAVEQKNIKDKPSVRQNKSEDVTELSPNVPKTKPNLNFITFQDNSCFIDVFFLSVLLGCRDKLTEIVHSVLPPFNESEFLVAKNPTDSNLDFARALLSLITDFDNGRNPTTMEIRKLFYKNHQLNKYQSFIEFVERVNANGINDVGNGVLKFSLQTISNDAITAEILPQYVDADVLQFHHGNPHGNTQGSKKEKEEFMAKKNRLDGAILDFVLSRNAGEQKQKVYSVVVGLTQKHDHYVCYVFSEGNKWYYYDGIGRVTIYQVKNIKKHFSEVLLRQYPYANITELLLVPTKRNPDSSNCFTVECAVTYEIDKEQRRPILRIEDGKNESAKQNAASSTKVKRTPPKKKSKRKRVNYNEDEEDEDVDDEEDVVDVDDDENEDDNDDEDDGSSGETSNAKHEMHAPIFSRNNSFDAKTLLNEATKEIPLQVDVAAACQLEGFTEAGSLIAKERLKTRERQRTPATTTSTGLSPPAELPQRLSTASQDISFENLASLLDSVHGQLEGVQLDNLADGPGVAQNQIQGGSRKVVEGGGGYLRHESAKTSRLTVHLNRSWKSDKKYMVTIGNKTIHFGQHGMSDFTKHHDPLRKKLYLQRHVSREDWTKHGIDTAGFWSRWLLWNKPSKRESIANLSRRFNLTVLSP